MSSASWYQVDTRKVAHETIDGEVIMIHLVLGSYFSLSGIGADVWELLAAGHGRDATLSALAEGYDAAPEQIEAAVDELLGRLAEEELVEPGAAEHAGPAAAEATPAGNGDRATGKRPFAPASLQKYTDMQDFLLVDPIHETDEAGWLPNPNRAP